MHPHSTISVIFFVLIVILMIQLGRLKSSSVNLKRAFGNIIINVLLLIGLSIYSYFIGCNTFIITITLLGALLANSSNLYIMAKEGRMIAGDCVNGLTLLAYVYILMTAILCVGDHYNKGHY